MSMRALWAMWAILVLCVLLAVLGSTSRVAPAPAKTAVSHCVEGDLCWQPLLMGNHRGTLQPMETDQP